MKNIQLLIVDDDPSVRRIFSRLAERNSWTFATAKNGYEALDFLAKHLVECVVLDMNFSSHSGFTVLDYLKSSGALTEVVVVTGSHSVDQAVDVLKTGVFDYLNKPLEDLSKITGILEKALGKYRLAHQMERLKNPLKNTDRYGEMLGGSPAMQKIYDLIESLKNSSVTVLIQGESGTGKEKVARAIHATSPRCHKKFQVINCAAIPENLLESELFGHMRGAFTGAFYDRKGLFEEAEGGTVFLDEIGEISPGFQVKLLRFLQDGEYRRVGDSQDRHGDVRIIAATHRDLKNAIMQGDFREDLYYRLHVIGIHLPPLRERKEDIPLLAQYFLQRFKEKNKKNIKEISVEAMQVLSDQEWLGNVRELENVMERCVVLAEGEVLRVRDLPVSILSKHFYLEEMSEVSIPLSYKEAKVRALNSFHQAYLSHLLKMSGGNISIASDQAGMDRSNFKKILKKYQVSIQEFRKGRD